MGVSTTPLHSDRHLLKRPFICLATNTYVGMPVTRGLATLRRSLQSKLGEKNGPVSDEEKKKREDLGQIYLPSLAHYTHLAGNSMLCLAFFSLAYVRF